MSTTHTPGPWTYWGGVAFFGIWPAYMRVHNRHNCIGEARTESNARLIAAAPDLLAACEESTSMKPCTGGQCGQCGIEATVDDPIMLGDSHEWTTICENCNREHAADAIAKARGEA